MVSNNQGLKSNQLPQQAQDEIGATEYATLYYETVYQQVVDRTDGFNRNFNEQHRAQARAAFVTAYVKNQGKSFDDERREEITKFISASISDPNSSWEPDIKGKAVIVKILSDGVEAACNETNVPATVLSAVAKRQQESGFIGRHFRKLMLGTTLLLGGAGLHELHQGNQQHHNDAQSAKTELQGIGKGVKNAAEAVEFVGTEVEASAYDAQQNSEKMQNTVVVGSEMVSRQVKSQGQKTRALMRDQFNTQKTNSTVPDKLEKFKSDSSLFKLKEYIESVSEEKPILK